jgi:hypothetical protein
MAYEKGVEVGEVAAGGKKLFSTLPMWRRIMVRKGVKSPPTQLSPLLNES